MQTELKWKLKDPVDAEAVARMSAELGIDPVLSTLLVQRGITTFAEGRKFFRPSLDDLHDPFLMKDMDKAVERLEKAVRGGERILVYGDYDVDGTAAVSLVYSFLQTLTSKVSFYIPDRYEEGSGISGKGIETAAAQGVSLIIALDCGIKAVEKVRLAASKGIDFIICEHHLPDDVLPPAVAVLDPKREDDSYPYDDLCGCGVGFKLVQAYAMRNNIPFEKLTGLLDLVVVAISSDLVGMTGENRVLAYYGLKQLNENPRRGLKTLIALSNLEAGHVTIDDIVFKIGPRINAAGRMESTGHLAVELLVAEDDKTALEAGRKINDSNNERKRIDREVTKAAIEKVQSGDALSQKNATIVYNPKWNKGVIGIVASRLVEAFYKPAIVLTKSSNGLVTGSARSIGEFNIYDAIERCENILVNFGGHQYAAGLTLREEDLPEFAARVDKYVSDHRPAETKTPVEEIDARLDFKQITPRFFRLLKMFQPFGPGNASPVFETDNVYDSGNGRKVGPAGQHLKLDLIEESMPYHRIPAIGFNMSSYYPHIKEGNPIDVCYSIVENYYRGTSSIQLRIHDIHTRDVMD